MAFYKWKPSKKQAAEFAKTMNDIQDFCDEHGIFYSRTMDSYYFTFNDIDYRVSNHTIEASNRGAYDKMGNKLREFYHCDGRKEDTIYIHASKTRLIQIYSDIIAGHKLDGRGNKIVG